ncbi:DNA excision repair protein, putative, partial [Bodo saltans]
SVLYCNHTARATQVIFMADELTRLGVNWQDESDVRVHVAAGVAADSSLETADEQNHLQQAWKELHEAESEMQRCEGIPPPQRTGGYSMELEEAERTVERKMKQVKHRQAALEQKKLQLKYAEVERQHAAVAEQMRQRQRQRLEEARQDASQGGPQALNAAGATVAVPYRPIQRRAAAVLPVQRRVAAQAHPAGAAEVPVTDAIKEYRGGDTVVEPVHCVALTKADRSSAAGSYRDDGDADMFAQRQLTLQRERSKQLKSQRKEAEEAARRLVKEETKVKRERGDEDDFLAEMMAADAEAELHNNMKPEEDDDDATNVSSTDDDDDGVNLPPQELLVPVPQLPMFTTPKWLFEALLDYQRVGLQWLIGLHHKRVGGILGDEMGLGKTVQVAALLNTLLTSQLLLGPALIVAPLTVVAQWVRELHRWCPQLRACVLHSTGTSASKATLMESVRNRPAAVVTTYTTMALLHRELASVNFQYVILDEGHKVCNPDTAVTMGAKTFFTPHRLILTGSPIQNTLKELWCLFDFAYPGLLGTLNKFVEEFEVPISASRSSKASKLDAASAIECARILKAHLQPFLLRRMKRDVNAMLPPKYERVIRCSLTDAQLEAYSRVLNSRDVQALLGVGINHKFNTGGLDRHGRDAGGALWTGNHQFAGQRGLSSGARRQAFRILHSLRNLCNHVDIFYLKQDDVNDGGTGRDISFRSNNAVRYEGSGKLATLKRLLTHWKANGHKVLVFSQFRMMLDIMENMCEEEKHSYMRMDGNTPSKDRALLIDRYNSDPSVFVALLTTKVGGLGVNLTGADRVVIFDPDWNPVNDEQARERAWRIGQTREVCVYRMISSGTIEETILHRQLAKTYVTEKVLNDPTLQRCFSMHSFVEAFYLGTEYRQRLPNTLHHIISSVGDLASAESDRAMEREVVDLDETATVPTTAIKKQEEEGEHDVKKEQDDARVLELDHQKRLDILQGHVDPIHPTPGGGAAAADMVGSTGRVEGGATFKVTMHRTSENHTSNNNTVGGGGSAGESGAELGLLQQMVDGAGPSVSPLGHDRVGRNLAIMTARDTLQRVLHAPPPPPQPAVAPRPGAQRGRGGGRGGSGSRGRGGGGSVKRERE